MSDVKHTPGPWDHEFKPGCNRMEIWANGMKVAEVIGFAGFDFANARLIAAAPDLLAACKHAFRLLAERGDPFSGDDWEIGHRLSAAIGKATGGEEPQCLRLTTDRFANRIREAVKLADAMMADDEEPRT